MYASMSGSGSSIYGIFKEKPEIPAEIKEFIIYEGVL
jgi:4-diphosphocytidyl-2C-methyl-D-erythritol kinase